MTLDELLEQFDEVLDSGFKIPGKKTVVDVEKLRAVVDDIMRRADEGLTANLGEIRKTRAALKQPIPTATKEQ